MVARNSRQLFFAVVALSFITAPAVGQENKNLLGDYRCPHCGVNMDKGEKHYYGCPFYNPPNTSSRGDPRTVPSPSGRAPSGMTRVPPPPAPSRNGRRPSR